MLGSSVLAQTAKFSGTIKSDKGEALPYASVYVKNTQNGTLCNENGQFKLDLKPGTYTIVFQYLGYKAASVDVEIGGQPVEQNIVLEPETKQLVEVTVSDKYLDEDPAYPIIRNAIRRRKYHLNEIEAYSCRTYMKVIQRLNAVPKSVMGFKISRLDTGIVYLSESISELNFKRPKTFKEKLISSKVSGSNRSISFNNAAALDINFYENIINPVNVNERGSISPIASDALFYYDYQWQDSFEEDGYKVHKIKVIPRRKNDPVFRGNIYIIEGSYRIHSLDLMLTKDAGIEFIEYIKLSQQYKQVGDGIWMLFSQKANFKFEALGFKGVGNGVIFYSNYKVQPSSIFVKEEKPGQETAVPENIPEPEPAPKPVVKAQKKQKPSTDKIKEQIAIAQKSSANKKAGAPKDSGAIAQQLFTKNFFSSGEVMSVDNEANKKDSAYWAEVRPIPLTEEEKVDYVKKDSIVAVKESKAYNDSIDKKDNIPGFNSLLFGYRYVNTFKKQTITFEPIYRIYQYNSVEGHVANLAINFTQRYEDRRQWEIEPTLRYGFNNQMFSWKLEGYYLFDNYNNRSVTVEGGSFVNQFNNGNPISPEGNTLYTLFIQENYLKIYRKNYVSAGYGSELFNGFYLNAMAEYAQREQLYNLANIASFGIYQKGFSPNDPSNSELANTGFAVNNSMMISGYIKYKPGQQYISRPNAKFVMESKYPTLTLNYRKGLPWTWIGSSVNYDLVQLKVEQTVKMGLVGDLSYELVGGIFWNNSSMSFMDYKHFLGNKTIFARAGFSGFQLLDYYQYSTQQGYAHANVAHHFNGFIFNKIPLFRKLKLQEVVSFNYLYTGQSKNYMELGFGLEHIVKILRIDYFMGFQERQQVTAGIRIGIGF
ncbi:MAG: carboxypeptidase-like regulatory domain-containing protein [Cytophagales bacterium]|nr:carboxypeptidase-like regulatory domain-containing protein [Cytophagales bacterium]